MSDAPIDLAHEAIQVLAKKLCWASSPCAATACQAAGQCAHKGPSAFACDIEPFVSTLQSLGWGPDAAKLREENERLKSDVTDLLAASTETATENTELRARVERLEGALKPFAKLLIYGEDGWADDGLMSDAWIQQARLALENPP